MSARRSDLEAVPARLGDRQFRPLRVQIDLLEKQLDVAYPGAQGHIVVPLRAPVVSITQGKHAQVHIDLWRAYVRRKHVRV